MPADGQAGKAWQEREGQGLPVRLSPVQSLILCYSDSDSQRSQVLRETGLATPRLHVKKTITALRNNSPNQLGSLQLLSGKDDKGIGF